MSATVQSVRYSGYVQGTGWQASVADGATAGTIGKALRMEGVKVSGINLTYRAHVQSVGWMGWVQEGVVAGRPGSGLRMEAVQIKSEDPEWRIEYRAHVQTLGWQPWVHDGATAGTTGRALRLEALQVRLIEVSVPMERAVTLTFTADNGLDATAQTLFAAIGKSGAAVNCVLGDFAYEPGKEQAYCTMINGRVNFPTELVAGTHEGDTIKDGLLSRYAACLPDRLGAVGTYAKDYYFDRGCVRVILISPALLLGGVTKTYANGTPEQAWLVARIREARAAGQWVVVGMHNTCMTLGVHGAVASPHLADALLREGVDLVVSGHDHNYIRSHQLAGTVANLTVVDNAGPMVRGAGTVFAIVGNGGHNPRTVGALTPLWAAASGTNSPGGITYGFGQMTADPTALSWRLVRTSGGPLADTFTIGTAP